MPSLVVPMAPTLSIETSIHNSNKNRDSKKPQKEKKSQTQPTNPLLVKSPVGRARPTCFTLPPEDHVYGKIMNKKLSQKEAPLLFSGVQDDDTSLALINAKKQSQARSKSTGALDYLAMNKLALREHQVSSKAQYEYRKTHPVVKSVATGAASGASARARSACSPTSGPSSASPRQGGRPLPSDTDPNFAYGVQTRPSSPIAKLMNGFYLRHQNGSTPGSSDPAKTTSKGGMPQDRKSLDSTTGSKKSPIGDDITQGPLSSSSSRKPRTLKEQIVPLQKPKIRFVPIAERDPASLFKMPRFRDASSRVDDKR